MVQSEERCGGIYVEWHHQRQVVAVRAASGAIANREHTDCWVNTVTEIMDNWPPSTPYRAINDTTHSQYTRYGAQEAEKLAAKIPKMIEGRVASVIPRSPIVALMQLFTGRLMKNHFPALQFRMFTNFDKALAWVSEGIETASNAPK